MEAIRPEEKPTEILLEDLPEKYSMLTFMVDANIKKITVEQELSFKAGELVGKLYDMMLPLYKDPSAESTLQSLNKFCVRIVFCLYAEDALLFGPRGTEFHDYLAGESNTRMALMRLFFILDQRENDREPYTEKVLMDFPYVNGGLFAESIEIPIIPDDVKNLILKDMSENLDWSKISPTIFGAVFESTLNPETRRSGGMHYTSVKNIHKVIDPLFLDALEAEFDKILTDKMSENKRRTALETFHNKLTTLYFMDPACGSGNFLTETFLSIRRLENRVIEYLQKGQIVFEFANPVKVSIKQFAGIEINDFAVTVARTALWIAESQMIKETETIVNQTIDFFPLKTDAKIVEGNALLMDWNDVMVTSKYALAYIMGNPPFGGAMMIKEKRSEIEKVFPECKKPGEIDYVVCWFIKAAKFISGTKIKVAFVATNSICQGQSVHLVWKPMLTDFHMRINFAYQTFKWQNDSNNSAAVNCVIVGFSDAGTFYQSKKPIIYTVTNEVIETDNINGYLMPMSNIFISDLSKPISDVPEMFFGSMPRDGGNFILKEDEKNELIKKYPFSEKWIRLYLGAEEFINKKKRYCLWLVNADATELMKCQPVMERIKKVQEFRFNSKAEATRKFGNTPTLFCQIAQPNTGSYIIVPRVSSENRKYIPMDFLPCTIIASDAVQIIPGASIYDFGILTSNVHMAWMRTIAGRLEMRYRYSKNLVYNTFPFPDCSDTQKEKITKTAQAILDVRKKYETSSFANMYDNDMILYPDLKKAHQDNDRAVMEAYGMWGKVNSEAECVAWLFRMYQELTKDK